MLTWRGEHPALTAMAHEFVREGPAPNDSFELWRCDRCGGRRGSGPGEPEPRSGDPAFLRLGSGRPGYDCDGVARQAASEVMES